MAVQDRYGSADRLHPSQIDKTVIAAGEILNSGTLVALLYLAAFKS